MTEQENPKTMQLYPPPPKEFDPFTASKDDLERHGLPLRPNPHTQPGMAALWERQADRYRAFEHLEPQPETATANKKATATKQPGIRTVFGPDPNESCGYSLSSSASPFTALFVTWTVPNLEYSPSPNGLDYFHTFVSLGFLDVHVEMTVDTAQHVTAQLWAQDVGNINLPVAPGDVLSGSLCLDTRPPGTAHYFLANETREQTVNFTVDTGFPPAVTISAGVTRGEVPNLPFDPLARFGVVYFDEISAYTTSGSRLLTSGDAITMVDQSGSALARPAVLNDFAFKTVCAAQ